MSAVVVRKAGQIRSTVIQVVHGDLTLESTQAIGTLHTVNPANSELILGGGVAGAILRLGGSIIQQECSTWTKSHGPVPVGQSAYTGAGKLNCEYVIHTVGPRYSGSGPLPVFLLESAVSSALTQAEALHVVSVSMPAISSGIFGYPKRECAESLLGTAVEWIRTRKQTKLERIRFINIDEETVCHFEAIFDQFVK